MHINMCVARGTASALALPSCAERDGREELRYQDNPQAGEDDDNSEEEEEGEDIVYHLR